VKVEIRVRFNTGEIVEDFVVLNKIEFNAMHIRERDRERENGIEMWRVSLPKILQSV